MRRATLLAAVLLASPFVTRASAQSATSTGQLDGGRFEVSAGLLWIGQAGLGTRDAAEATATGGSYRLFSTTNDIAAAPAATVRLGMRATRRVQIEAGGSFSRPALETAVGSDAEGAPSTILSDSLLEIAIDGAVSVSLAPWHVGTGVPFATAGVGYLRQLHDTRVLAETGQTYHLGGGIKWPLLTRSAARVQTIGLRVDAGVLARRKGVAFDTRLHMAPSLAASLFARF